MRWGLLGSDIPEIPSHSSLSNEFVSANEIFFFSSFVAWGKTSFCNDGSGWYEIFPLLALFSCEESLL